MALHYYFHSVNKIMHALVINSYKWTRMRNFLARAKHSNAKNVGSFIVPKMSILTRNEVPPTLNREDQEASKNVTKKNTNIQIWLVTNETQNLLFCTISCISHTYTIQMQLKRNTLSERYLHCQPRCVTSKPHTHHSYDWIYTRRGYC